MARPKKTTAKAKAEDKAGVDFAGAKLSVREIMEAHQEAHGKPGEPPVEYDERRNKEITMRAENHAFRRADFSGSNLEGADLQGMNLRSSVFKGCNLRDVDFRDANLQGCNFMGADMEGAMLEGADLRWAIAPNGNAFPQEEAESA